MQINNLETNVLDYGEGKQAVLLLHGWGGCAASMLGLANDLSIRYRVIIPDLWGWGLSQKPPSDFGIFEYAKGIAELLNQKNLKQVCLIGHSFGGRIGLVLASQYPQLISKLILIDSAGVKPKFSLCKYLKIKKYKHLKALVERGEKSSDVLSKFGSTDYMQLDEQMQKVFVRVVNQHLNNLLDKIFQPTLIIWGKKDKQTPLYMAKVLHKKIKSSKIIQLKGGHFAYLTEKREVLKAVFKFLEEN